MTKYDEFACMMKGPEECEEEMDEAGYDIDDAEAEEFGEDEE